MTGLSERAERVAAHIVSHETGSIAEPQGRQGAIDFLLTWPDGRRGGLEVTLVTERESAASQGMAMRDGWRWPASSGRSFRPNSISFPYRATKKIVIKAVSLCDEWRVGTVSEVPDHVIANDTDLRTFITQAVGELTRTPFSPGVVVYQATRAEFIDATAPDFSTTVESWLDLPHVIPHIEKTRNAEGHAERHLFIVPVSESLPARFFTDDFEAPERKRQGLDGIDGLWIWSDYWHRYLSLRGGEWSWRELPNNR